MKSYFIFEKGGLNLLTGDYLYTNNNYSYIFSDFIYFKFLTSKIIIHIPDFCRIRYVLFDEDKKYEKYINWISNSPYTILNLKNKYFRIIIGKKDETEFSEEDIINLNSNFYIESVSELTDSVSELTDSVSELTDSVSGNNVIDPKNLIQELFYYDFSDGSTIISTKNRILITLNKIKFSSSTAYIQYNGTQDLSNNIFLIYCYSDKGDFLGIRSTRITKPSLFMNLYPNTEYIHIYVNSDIDSKYFCLSKVKLDSFEEYKISVKIKKEKIPGVVIEKDFLPFYEKTIVNFGDSIFGNKRPPNDISTALANLTGATVYNLGFGGCRMAKHNNNWDAFSMYRLAYAIANNDFSIQDAVDISSVSGMPSYFEETRMLLKNIDWNKVDIISSFKNFYFKSNISFLDRRRI